MASFWDPRFKAKAFTHQSILQAVANLIEVCLIDITQREETGGTLMSDTELGVDDGSQIYNPDSIWQDFDGCVKSSNPIANRDSLVTKSELRLLIGNPCLDRRSDPITLWNERE